MNLVSLIMKFLSPDLIMKIASTLGLDRSLIEKGIGAIVPSVLSGLAGASARPEGARSIMDTIGKLDPGMLGNLAGMIGGSNQAQLVNSGSSMLSGMLGNSAVGALTGALGKFTGMGEGASRSLLGMVAPAVVGTLGQQVRQSNLDASGLAGLLASQRDNISAAMPAGFGQLLGGSGLLDGIGGNVRSMAGAAAGAATSAAGAATSAARSAGDAAGRMASTASHTAQRAAGGGSSWLLWLVLLAALAAGAWYFVGRQHMPSASIPAVMVEGTDVGKQLNGMVDDMKGILGQVKDEASAKGALPKLEEVLKTTTNLQGLAGRAGGEARKSIAGVAATVLRAIDPIINQALAMTGVGAILKPILDNIRGRIEAIAKG